MDGLLFPQKQPPWLLPAGDYELDYTHPLTEGLVGYWPLSGNAVDLSIHGNNGTLVNTPTSVIGALGPAMNFNGSNQYVTIPYISAYNAANFTWTGWIKTTTSSGNGNCIMALASSSSSDYGMTVFIYGGDIAIDPKNGGNANSTPVGGAVTDGKWHHFAISGNVNSGQYVSIYLDGVLSSTGTNSSTWSWNANPIRLAISQDGYWSIYNGAMMGVSVYNTALSASQIARLHAEPFAMLRPISRRIYYCSDLGAPISGVQGVSAEGTVQAEMPINNATPIGVAGTGSVGTLSNQIAAVASVGFGGTSSGGNSSGSPINTTGATLLVMTASMASNATIPTPSDSYSNTWIPVLSRQSNGTSAGTVLLYYVLNPTVGTGHTFTFSGTGTYSCAQVTAWSGVTISNTPLETGAITAASASASSIATGSITPNQNNSLIIAAYSLASVTGSPTINDSFSVSSQTAWSNGVTYGGAQASLIQTTATAVNPTWTLGGTGQVATAIAAFGSAATPVNLEVPNVYREVLLQPAPPPLEVSNVWREVLVEPPAPPLEVSNVWQEVLIQTYPVPLSIAAENKPSQVFNIIRKNAQTYDVADQEDGYATRRLLLRNASYEVPIPLTLATVTGVYGTGEAGSLASFEVDTNIAAANATGVAGLAAADISATLIGANGTGEAGNPVGAAPVSGVYGTGEAGSMASFEVDTNIAATNATGLAEALMANVFPPPLTGLFGTGETESLIAGFTFAGVFGTSDVNAPTSYIDTTLIATIATGLAETLDASITIETVVGVDGEGEIGDLIAVAAPLGVVADSAVGDLTSASSASGLSVFGQGDVGELSPVVVIYGVYGTAVAATVTGEGTLESVFGTGFAHSLFPKLIASSIVREMVLAETTRVNVANLIRESVLTEPTQVNISNVVRESVLTEIAQINVSNVVRETVLAEIGQVYASNVIREAVLAEIAPVQASSVIREVSLSETAILNVSGLVREVLLDDGSSRGIVLVVT